MLNNQIMQYGYSTLSLLCTIMDITMLGLYRLLCDAFHVLATLLLLGKQQNCAN
jgi:hypothetical protein